MFKSKEKQMREECYNLDYSLVKWLNEHLKFYLAEGGKIVNFDVVKIQYGRKEYTQGELIEKLIEITDSILKDYFEFNLTGDVRKNVSKMYDILKKLHWLLWW